MSRTSTVVCAILLSVVQDFATMVDAQASPDDIPTPDEEFSKPPAPPACYAGKEWHECGSACEKTCEEPSPLCTFQCVPKCQCPAAKPYWDGLACVAGNECPLPAPTPPPAPTCKGGQVFKECGSQCTRTCANPDPLCSKQCVAKCQCPDDMPFWNAENQDCVAENGCPLAVPTVTPTAIPTAAPTPICGGGQIFKDCASVCTPTCADPRPFCTKHCVSKCACPAFKPLWDGVSQCIASATCPKRPILTTKVNLYYPTDAPLSPYSFFEDTDTRVKTSLRNGLLEAVGQHLVIGDHPNVTVVITGASEASSAQRDNLLATFDASPKRNAVSTLEAVNVEVKLELLKCDGDSNAQLEAMKDLLIQSTKNGKFVFYLGKGGLLVPAIAVQRNFVQPCHTITASPTDFPTKSPTVPTAAPTSVPTKKPTPATIQIKLQLSDLSPSDFPAHSTPLEHGIVQILQNNAVTVAVTSVEAISDADRAAAESLAEQFLKSGVRPARHGEISSIDAAVVVSIQLSIDSCTPGKGGTMEALEHAVGSMRSAIALGVLNNHWEQDGLHVPAAALQQEGRAMCEVPEPTVAPTAAPTQTPAEFVATLQLYSVTREEFDGWSAESSKHKQFLKGVQDALALPDSLSEHDITLTITSVKMATEIEKNAAIAIIDESGGNAKQTLPALAVTFEVRFFRCSSVTNSLVRLLPTTLKSKISKLMFAWGGMAPGFSVPALAVQNSMVITCDMATAAPTGFPTKSPTASLNHHGGPYTSPAPTPALVYVNDHAAGKSHFEVAGKPALNPGVSVRLHLFGLPTKGLFSHIKVRKIFEDAVQAAFCPAGPRFDDCQWRSDLGEKVVVESYRENAQLAPAERMYDSSGEMTGDKKLRFLEHTVQKGYNNQGEVFEMTASNDIIHSSEAVEVNFRLEFNNSCAGDAPEFIRDLPGKVTGMVESGALLTYLFSLDVTAMGYPWSPSVYRSCDPVVDLQLPAGHAAPASSEATARCVWTGHKVHVVHRHHDPRRDREFFCRHYVDDTGSHECGCHHWEKGAPTAAPTKFNMDALFEAITPAPTHPTGMPTPFPTRAPTTPFPTAAPTAGPTEPAAPATAPPTKPPTKDWKKSAKGWWNMDSGEQQPPAPPTAAPATDGETPTEVDTDTTDGFNHAQSSSETALGTESSGATTPGADPCGGNGQVYTQCGACTLTCANLSPDCPDSCVPRCECPSDAPVWHNHRCVTAAACAAETIKVDSDTAQDPTTLGFPPESVVDCKMSEWTPLTDCSKTCGGGELKSVRTIILGAMNGGTACPTDLEKTVPCGEDPCPTPPTPVPPPTAALPTSAPTFLPTTAPTPTPTASPTRPTTPLAYQDFIQLPVLGSNIQAMDGDTEHVYLATKTQLVKVRKADMKQVAAYDLFPDYKLPTALAVDDAHVFVTTTNSRDVSQNVLLKLTKDSLAVASSAPLPRAANVPYSMRADADFVYTGHYAAPGQVLKLSKRSLGVVASIVLDAGENDLRQMEMDGQYLFANCNTQPGRIVKIDKDEMVKIKTAVLPAGANNPLAGCLAPATLYNEQKSSLFVGTSTEPAVIVKLTRDNMEVKMSRALSVGYVSAMVCDAAHIYATTYTQNAKLMKIRQTDLMQVQQLQLGHGGGTGMLAAASADQNDVYAATDTENGRVYKVSGVQAVATAGNVATAPEFDAP